MNTPLAWQGRSELPLLQDFLNKDNRSNCYSNKHLKGQSELWLAGTAGLVLRYPSTPSKDAVLEAGP